MKQGRLALVTFTLVAAGAFGGCLEAAQNLAAAAAEGAIGCIDGSGAQSQLGQFSYAGAASCKTANETHDFPNPSPYAEVQWGGAIARGSLAVVIRDGLDREVDRWEITAAEAGGAQGRTDAGFPTAEPLTGAWKIEMTFVDFTGTMGLQVKGSSVEESGLRAKVPPIGLAR